MYTNNEQPLMIYRVQNEHGLGVVYHHLEQHSFDEEAEELPEWAINFKAPPHEVFYPATKLGLTTLFSEQPRVRCWFTRKGFQERASQIKQHLNEHPELRLVRATLLTKPVYQDKVQVVF